MDTKRASAIRQAIASGEYLRAGSLWNEYASLLHRRISRGICTLDDMEEARELFEWSRQTVALARAHSQCQLDALRVAGRYAETDPREAALLRTCV
jgi:hypothetical protein